MSAERDGRRSTSSGSAIGRSSSSSVEPPRTIDGDDHDPDSVPERRLRGYREALAASGTTLPDEAIVESPASIEGGRVAFRRAWLDGRRPTAVLAMSDITAFGAMSAARDLGLSIPRDLSIVGFDDLDLAEHTDPPLTTVHQPVRMKAAEAASWLLALVDGRPSPGPDHVVLPTRLVIRGSTAAPRRRVSGGRR